MNRTLFLVSDHTGITVEAVTRALMSQFNEVSYRLVVHSFIDSEDKLKGVVRHINETHDKESMKPLVFSSLVAEKDRELLRGSKGVMLDLFDIFLQPLASALQQKPRQISGMSHGIRQIQLYDERVDAMNFALDHDDGLKTREFEVADVILLGVSRTGKTPSCVYLALHYGLRAANYPLTEEDFEKQGLPEVLRAHKHKLFALTIDPERLHNIREQRLAGSVYASLAQCRKELQIAERLFRTNNIPRLDTTASSIEEIASKIVDRLALASKL